MVWFSCEDCGDSIKKPKLQAHMNSCSASRLTCLDCNYTFMRNEVKGHSQCVTEHQKYAEGVTKAAGFKTAGKSELLKGHVPDNGDNDDLPSGPPWNCRTCNISCTSRDTLAGHMAGAKHIRRARAAQRAAKRESGDSTSNAAPQSQAKDGMAHEQGPLPKKQKTGDKDIAAEDQSNDKDLASDKGVSESNGNSPKMGKQKSAEQHQVDGGLAKEENGNKKKKKKAARETETCQDMSKGEDVKLSAPKSCQEEKMKRKKKKQNGSEGNSEPSEQGNLHTEAAKSEKKAKKRKTDSA